MPRVPACVGASMGSRFGLRRPDLPLRQTSARFWKSRSGRAATSPKDKQQELFAAPIFVLSPSLNPAVDTQVARGAYQQAARGFRLENDLSKPPGGEVIAQPRHHVDPGIRLCFATGDRAEHGRAENSESFQLPSLGLIPPPSGDFQSHRILPAFEPVVVKLRFTGAQGGLGLFAFHSVFVRRISRGQGDSLPHAGLNRGSGNPCYGARNGSNTANARIVTLPAAASYSGAPRAPPAPPPVAAFFTGQAGLERSGLASPRLEIGFWGGPHPTLPPR